MYYTSSGGGGGGVNSKPSVYSGQDAGHQYAGSGTTVPPAPGSFVDPSSRLTSGTQIPYSAGMDHGQFQQTAYSGAASWVDSSLASAQRSLQSWKSVGLPSSVGATSYGGEHPSTANPLAGRTSATLPSSNLKGSEPLRPGMTSQGNFPGPNSMGSQPPGPGMKPQPLGPGVRGGMQNMRPRLPTGIQSFQPKGGAHVRSIRPASVAVRTAAPAQPTSAPSSTTAVSAASRNGTQFGGSQAVGQTPVRAQQPRYQGSMYAPSIRGSAQPYPANVVRGSRPSQPRPPDPRPLAAGPRMSTASPSAAQPVPRQSLTDFESRLQDFSTKSCTDLGIVVQPQLQGVKKHCSLEGFSTKQPADTKTQTANTSSSQPGDVNRDNDNDDDEDDDDDDDDDDIDRTQCKLCNIKFEKEQVCFELISVIVVCYNLPYG